MWDYPRPPALDPCDHHVVVRFGGEVVAETRRPVRVLETSQPPAYYLPRADVRLDLLRPSRHTTWCEWKGSASYVDVVVGDRIAPAAGWSYDEPVERFAAIAGYLAFYAQHMDECVVDGEVVDPNEGSFYGGWITSRIVGPFKGGPGTLGW